MNKLLYKSKAELYKQQILLILEILSSLDKDFNSNYVETIYYETGNLEYFYKDKSFIMFYPVKRVCINKEMYYKQEYLIR